jgi:alkylated DNA repair protein (DNA oxidative demethylase)
MTADLFDDDAPSRQEFAPGAFLLKGWVTEPADVLLAQVQSIFAASPPRHMSTPGGFRMSVAMSNCGDHGWVSDRSGYRYDRLDPDSCRPWPGMPVPWRELARAVAGHCGFEGFEPDACLVNRYEPGARMSLHQDRNERDFAQPIVSVSLGLAATFVFGGERRADRVVRVPLRHGDIVVWGGPARLRFHGVLPLPAGRHAVFGAQRINLTFRRVD